MKALVSIIAIFTIALAGLIVAAITAPGHREIRRATDSIGELQAEAGALRSRLQEFEQATSADGFAQSLLHEGATPSEATLGLQRVLVELAGTHGLVPSSFGGVPPPQGLNSPAVAVLLEGEGETEAIGRFLAAVETATPRIAVAQLALRDLPQRRTDGGVAPVSLRIVVWGFWSENGS